MRIAVLTDVHGNRFALEAVLNEIWRFKPDLILNLGDTVLGGADPAGAWRLHLESGALTVRGNADEEVSNPELNLEPERLEFVNWLRTMFDQTDFQTMQDLPTMLGVADGEILACHGSLETPWDFLMLRDQPESFVDYASPQELLSRIAAFPKAKVVLCGHSHRARNVTANGVQFVNVGSVSRQPDGDPRARWVLLTRDQHSWRVEHKHTSYDVEAAARWALELCPQGEREAAHLRLGTAPD
jgi:predicted phosphodiesterase